MTMKEIKAKIGKTLIAVILLLVCLSVSSCAENEYEGYNGDSSVYFQLDPNNWDYVGDSITFSFVGKKSDIATINLQVNLAGNIADHDRTIRLHVDEANTTAKVGTHYETLQTEYTLKAGEMQINIPLKVMNIDPLLNNHAVQITICIDETDDFKLKFTKRSKARIIVSNMVMKPSYWDDYSLDFYVYPTFSKKLVELMIELTGRMLPEDPNDFDYDYWMNFSKILHQYLEEHFPVYDENGNIMY